jgi:hypothetical protein
MLSAYAQHELPVAHKSGECGGLNFDMNSLFGSTNGSFFFDEIFPFDQSNSSGSSDVDLSNNGDSSSSNEAAITDPLGGIDIVFCEKNAKAPETQTTPSEDESVSSSNEVVHKNLILDFGDGITTNAQLSYPSIGNWSFPAVLLIAGSIDSLPKINSDYL